MNQLTFDKEEVRNAYLNKKRGRNFMLFLLYKEIFMTKAYSHEVIATKLSKDLEYPISMSVVNNIRCRFVNRQEQMSKPIASVGTMASSEVNSGGNSVDRREVKPKSTKEDAELPSGSDKQEVIIAGRKFTNVEPNSKNHFQGLDL